MNRRRQLLSFAFIAGRVARKRLLRGPKRPTWSFQYEAVLEFLREQFKDDAPLPRIRRRMDASGRLELRRNRVGWSAASPAGLDAQWAVPPDHDDRVILYLHGGGYAFGSYRSHRNLLANLAVRTRARVLAIDYRLAPEHPCPAAIEDAVASWHWLLDELDVSPDRAMIAGDSAGGGLTLATLVALRDAGAALPAGAALLSPWVDLSVSGDTPRQFADVDYLGDADRMYAFAGHYAGERDRRDPQVSPLFADLSDLPPIHVVAGGAELILDDATRVAERLEAAGTPVTLHVEPHEVHVYPMFADLTSRAAAAMDDIAAFFEQVTHPDAAGDAEPSAGA